MLHVLFNWWSKEILHSWCWLWRFSKNLRFDVALSLNVYWSLSNLLRDGLIINSISAILLSESLLLIDKPIEIEFIIDLEVLGVVCVPILDILPRSISELIGTSPCFPTPGPLLKHGGCLRLGLEEFSLLAFCFFLEVQHAWRWEFLWLVDHLVHDLTLLLLHWLLVEGVFTFYLNLLVIMLNKVEDWVWRRSSEAGYLVIAIVTINSIPIITNLVPSFILKRDKAVAWKLVFYEIWVTWKVSCSWRSFESIVLVATFYIFYVHLLVDPFSKFIKLSRPIFPSATLWALLGLLDPILCLPSTPLLLDELFLGKLFSLPLEFEF